VQLLHAVKLQFLQGAQIKCTMISFRVQFLHATGFQAFKHIGKYSRGKSVAASDSVLCSHVT